MNRRRPFRQTRSTEIPVEFVNGFARGWALPVGECFMEALDIRYTERVRTDVLPSGEKRKVRERMWTVGVPPLYAFKAWDLIATTHYPRPGENHHVLIQVIDARPDAWDSHSGTVKDGFVKAQIYRPSPDGGWRRAEIWYGTQAEFVELLRRGTQSEGLDYGESSSQ